MSQTGNGWSMGSSPAAPNAHTPAQAPDGQGAGPQGGAAPQLSGPQQATAQQAAPQSAAPQQPQYGQYAPGSTGAPGAPQYGQYGQYGVGAQQPSAQQAAPQSAAPHSAAPQQPQYGQYAPGSTGAPGAPQYGQYGTAQPGPLHPGQPGGYGFAPKPGIIPLRPLTLSDILDGAFAAMRSNPGVMFGFSFLFTLVISALSAVSFIPFENMLDSMLASPDGDDLFALTNYEVITAISAFLAYSIATTMLMGLLVLPVGRAALGRVISFSQLWQEAKGRLLRLLALSAIITLLTLIASLVVMSPALVLIFLLAGSISNGGLLLVLSFLLSIGGIVLSMVLYIRLSAAPAVLVLEKATILQSFKRSWSLTAGNFWRVFGILAVSSLITIAIGAALEMALALPILAAFSLTLEGGGAGAYWPLLIVTVVKQAFSLAIVLPFTAAVMSLVYIDLRIRKEGLDVDLAQAAAMEA
ncbi:hypothetical protein [Buchananella felis]|uniref:hypothetical protein n=1 Tax=Buchananella felis TaxID=3231492 RepID=UPI003529A795